MPWNASSVMEERRHFVACCRMAEAMTGVCREFGISRKIDYTITTASGRAQVPKSMIQWITFQLLRLTHWSSIAHDPDGSDQRRRDP